MQAIIESEIFFRKISVFHVLLYITLNLPPGGTNPSNGVQNRKKAIKDFISNPTNEKHQISKDPRCLF